MKLITAIIKPEQADNVKKALNKIGVVGLTMTDVKGYGRQKGHTEFYRGSEYEVAFLPKTKLEIAVSNKQYKNALETILKTAKTGKIGDGKIFVTNLSEVIRVRTSEKGSKLQKVPCLERAHIAPSNKLKVKKANPKYKIL